VWFEGELGKISSKLGYNRGMNIGRILLGWLAIAVVIAMIVVALMAYGIISVHVEIVPKDEDDEARRSKRHRKGTSAPSSASSTSNEIDNAQDKGEMDDTDGGEGE